jgi:hypothetical protein
MKSRAAILIASIPRLAPLVPAPISDFTSIIFILRIGCKGKERPSDCAARGGYRDIILIICGGSIFI